MDRPVYVYETLQNRFGAQSTTTGDYEKPKLIPKTTETILLVSAPDNCGPVTQQSTWTRGRKSKKSCAACGNRMGGDPRHGSSLPRKQREAVTNELSACGATYMSKLSRDCKSRMSWISTGDSMKFAFCDRPLCPKEK